MSVIQRLLARAEEQDCDISQVERSPQDIKDLDTLWHQLTSQIYSIFDNAPTYYGDTQTFSDTGMTTRVDVRSMIWICKHDRAYSLMGEAEITTVILIPQEDA